MRQVIGALFFSGQYGRFGQFAMIGEAAFQ